MDMNQASDDELRSIILEQMCAFAALDCNINFKDCTELSLFVVLCSLLAVLLGLSLSVL